MDYSATENGAINAIDGEHPPHVGPVEFFVRAKRLEKLIREINAPAFHALFAIKRSGWVLGVILSHALGLPVFARVEIDNIPSKLSRFMIVDTASWTGRSVRHAAALLTAHGSETVAAALLHKRRDLNFPPELTVVFETECTGIPRYFFHPDFKYQFCADAGLLAEAERLAASSYPEYPKPPK